MDQKQIEKSKSELCTTASVKLAHRQRLWCYATQTSGEESKRASVTILVTGSCLTPGGEEHARAHGLRHTSPLLPWQSQPHRTGPTEGDRHPHLVGRR